jgi:hypothetical protein
MPRMRLRGNTGCRFGKGSNSIQRPFYGAFASPLASQWRDTTSACSETFVSAHLAHSVCPPPFPLTRPRDAFPQFNRKFGVKLADGTFQVPAPWQAGLSNVHASLASQLDPCPSLTLGSQGANVGEIIGLFINGIVSERFGYKYTILVCLIIMAGLIAIPVTANSVEALLVYYILAGVPWGIWQTCSFYCPRCVEAQCPHACPFSDNHLRF